MFSNASFSLHCFTCLFWSFFPWVRCLRAFLKHLTTPHVLFTLRILKTEEETCRQGKAQHHVRVTSLQEDGAASRHFHWENPKQHHLKVILQDHALSPKRASNLLPAKLAVDVQEQGGEVPDPPTHFTPSSRMSVTHSAAHLPEPKACGKLLSTKDFALIVFTLGVLSF